MPSQKITTTQAMTYAQRTTGREYSKFCTFVFNEIMLSEANIQYHNLSNKLATYWEDNCEERGVYNEDVFTDFVSTEYMLALFNNGEYHDWGDDWNMYNIISLIFKDQDHDESSNDRIIQAIKEQDQQFLLSYLALNIDVDSAFNPYLLELWEIIKEDEDEYEDEDEDEEEEEEPLPIDEQYKELFQDKDYQKWLVILHSKVHPWVRKEKDRVYTLKPVIIELPKDSVLKPEKPKAGTKEYSKWYRENKLTPEKKAAYKAKSKAKENEFRGLVRAEFFRKLEVEDDIYTSMHL